MVSDNMKDNGVVTITMPRKGKFTLYRKDIADRQGIRYKSWREALGGEFALTDNDWVVPVFNRYEWGVKQKNAVIRTPVGSFNAERRGQFLFNKDRKDTSSSFRSQGQSSLFREDKIESLSELFWRFYFTGISLKEAWSLAYKVAYNRRIKWVRTLQYFLKNELFRRKFMSKLEELFDEYGFDKKIVITGLKNLCENNKHKDHFNALKFAAELLKITGRDSEREIPAFEMTREDEIDNSDVIPELSEKTQRILRG